MSDPVRTLVDYRIERARESLSEALLLLESGHINTYVNRLYYACFYAVSAYLLYHGKSSAKHSGVRALFHQEVVKLGLVDQELGQLYDRLFDNRQKADYADLVVFDPTDVAEWYAEASGFVQALIQLLEVSSGAAR